MRKILLFIAFLLPFFCYSQDYLKSNEKSVFEFATVNGKRLVLALDTNKEYLVYRFGKNKNIEFQFPNELSDSWKEFEFSWYFRGGGPQNEGLDLNYLYFENGNFRYVVFQEYSARSKEVDCGIKVINRETNEKMIIKAAPKSVKGNLLDFRHMELIKVGHELF